MAIIKNKCRILAILRDSVVDGEGLRSVIFFSGCPHHCIGCQNEESWSPQSGKEITIDEVIKYATQTENNQITFSGGDPLSFEYWNALEIAKILKTKYKKDIWVYTGFTWEKIINSKRLSKILPYIDVIVDGKFEKEKLDLSLQFRGSSNQRIIDVQPSLQQHKPILWHE